MEEPVSVILDLKGSALYWVKPDAPVADAVHMMNEENIGSVLVMEPGGKLVGIFTERDVLRRVIDGGLDYGTTRVSEVMSDTLTCIKPNTTVQEAMMIVDQKNCRHLPVIDNEQVTGVISVRDLVNHMVRDQAHRIAELTDYISGNYGRNARIQ